MSNPVMQVFRQVKSDDTPIGRGCWVWCPGCDSAHRFQVVGEDGTQPEGPCWTWDGNLERPTFNPSLLCYEAGSQPRCHSFLHDGQWQFLADCTHKLAGQTVPMVPLPDWLVR